MGVHPLVADQWDEAYMDRLFFGGDLNLPLTKLVGVGECGLDRSGWSNHQLTTPDALGAFELQKIAFRGQCLLAAHYNLPITIHCRDSPYRMAELFRILDGEMRQVCLTPRFYSYHSLST